MENTAEMIFQDIKYCYKKKGVEEYYGAVLQTSEMKWENLQQINLKKYI